MNVDNISRKSKAIDFANFITWHHIACKRYKTDVNISSEGSLIEGKFEE